MRRAAWPKPGWPTANANSSTPAANSKSCSVGTVQPFEVLTAATVDSHTGAHDGPVCRPRRKKVPYYAVLVFSGGPAFVVEQFVVGPAGEGQLVDVDLVTGSGPDGFARRRPSSAMTFIGTRRPWMWLRRCRLRSGAALGVERCQPARLAAVRETGLMWAKALRAFQVGKARTSHEGPWSWMRQSRVASAQVSWPACHLTKASASAVM